MRLDRPVRGSRNRKHQEPTFEALTRNARPTQRRSAYSTRAEEGVRTAFTKASVSVLAIEHPEFLCVPRLDQRASKRLQWSARDPLGTHNDWIKWYPSERNHTNCQLNTA